MSDDPTRGFRQIGQFTLADVDTVWLILQGGSVIDWRGLHFRDHAELYVSGKPLVFYEKGNRRKHVAPDLFVVRGVERKQRAQYKVWEERVPEFVLEITSASQREQFLQARQRASLSRSAAVTHSAGGTPSGGSRTSG